MKNWIYKLFAASIAIALIFGCDPKIDVPAPSVGTLDFSNYVAVGNSLTAGFSDGGLYSEVQSQSYPNLVAQQINDISVIEFRQPDIPGNGSGYMFLTSLAPAFGFELPDQNWQDQLEGPFNNLGVPGIRVKDIKFSGYGSSANVNPYYYRMLGGKSPLMTYLDFVEETNPTFFTNWLGNNDVLGYATSGGEAGIEGGLLGMGGLTPVAEFEQLYGEMMEALTNGGAKGIVITIPEVTLIPFFTTIPYLAVELDEQTANDLMEMTAFGGYNFVLDNLADLGVISQDEADKRKVLYEAGNNPILILDKDLDDLSAILGNINPALALYGQIRQSNHEDLMLFTSQTVLGTLADPSNDKSVIGVAVPLGDKYCLTKLENDNVKSYTNAYNEIIRGYASSGTIGVIESNDILQDINDDGVFVDGVLLESGYILGGTFSLDAVHLTPRGYAFVANAVIQEINNEFGSSISPVIINNHRAVVLP
jgi:lysophospholipase L1-like esterase